MPLIRRIAIAAAFLLLPAAANASSAQSNRTNIQLLAWSDDGASALLEERTEGREGGSSLQFRIVSGTAPKETKALVFDDLNRGDGAKTQHVDAKTCDKDLSALSTALTAKKFGKLATHTGYCKSKRTPKDPAAVTVPPGSKASAEGSWILGTRAKNNKGPRPFTLTFASISVGLTENGALVWTRTFPKRELPLLMCASLSPTRKMLMIVDQGKASEGQDSIFGIWTGPELKKMEPWAP